MKVVGLRLGLGLGVSVLGQPRALDRPDVKTQLPTGI